LITQIGAAASTRRRASVPRSDKPERTCSVDSHAAQRFFGRQPEQRARHAAASRNDSRGDVPGLQSVAIAIGYAVLA
jgi:hypothetical protein